MKLFRKLFAEKILRYYEGTEAGIKIIKKLPILKKLVREDSFGEKSKSRAVIGVLAQEFMLAWEFIRKFLYVVLLIYVPYIILAHFFPLIRIHQDISIIYLFIMLSTICGSLANTTIFAMGDRDYLMIRVMLVSPYMNFLGKFIYKLITEFIFLLFSEEKVINATTGKITTIRRIATTPIIIILILNDNKENAVFPNSNTSFLLSGIYFPPPIKYSFSHSSAFTFIKL